MTQKTGTQHGATRPDTKLLSNLIYQMNIVRRQVGAYPPGHQVIRTAATRTIKVLESLGATNEQITIGIARDRLMLGAAPLDPKNPVYREYARALFGHGLVALTIKRSLGEQELCDFCRLLACKPEELLDRGGFVAASAAAGIEHITLTPLDFRNFRTRSHSRTGDPETTASADPLPAWERFVSSLLVPGDGQQPEGGLNDVAITPEGLAGILGSKWDTSSADSCGGYDQAIATFLRDLDREELSRGAHDRLLDKFGTFINELQPGLRRQLLSSTFSALVSHESHAGTVLSRFSNEMLLDVLRDVNHRQNDIPPFILHLLGQLAPHGASPDMPQSERQGITPAEITDPLKLVFTEHRVDDFVPDDYQTLLRRCPTHQPAPTLPPEVIEGLTASVHEQTMEQRLCAIVSHMLQTPGDNGQNAGLKKHLSTLIQHFIATGDFSSLTDLHRRFGGISADAADSPPKNPKGIFDSYHFTREIVRSLSLWSQEKQSEIKILIQQIGPPFVPLLLDRLAEETERSLRYQYLKLLGDMGPVIREEVLKRLQDKRWYLLRNLIVLLRGLRDPQLMNDIEPMLRHPHERVRQEALKTAFHFNDPRADQVLLRELKRPPLPPTWAIGMARHSRDANVFQHLQTLLCKTALSNDGMTVRLAAVATLGNIGNPMALNNLETVLFSFNFRHPSRHRRLQRRIVESLESYPQEATASIRRRLMRSARPDLAELRRLLEKTNPGAPS